MVKHRSATLMALPVVAALVLSGCGSGQKPTAAAAPTSSSAAASASPTTSSASASPTASGPAIDPNIPAAARAKTAAGAESFVKYFVGQVNLSWTSPKPGLIAALSRSSCKSCTALEQTAAQLKRDGQHYDGPPLIVQTIAPMDHQENLASVLLVGLQARRNVLASNGKVVLTDPKLNLKREVDLLWIGSAWSVAAIKVMS